MDWRIIIFGVIDLVCWFLIAKVILENPNCHLVYKRPDWMQKCFDENEYWLKIQNYQRLKEYIESNIFDPESQEYIDTVKEFFKVDKELKQIEKRQRSYNQAS